MTEIRITEQEYREAFCHIALHKPTISDVRKLLSETLLTWPLVMLDAVMDSGIDIDANSNSRIVIRFSETDDLVDVKFVVVHGGE